MKFLLSPFGMMCSGASIATLGGLFAASRNRTLETFGLVVLGFGFIVMMVGYIRRFYL